MLVYTGRVIDGSLPIYVVVSVGCGSSTVNLVKEILLAGLAVSSKVHTTELVFVVVAPYGSSDNIITVLTLYKLPCLRGRDVLKSNVRLIRSLRVKYLRAVSIGSKNYALACYDSTLNTVSIDGSISIDLIRNEELGKNVYLKSIIGAESLVKLIVVVVYCSVYGSKRSELLAAALAVILGPCGNILSIVSSYKSACCSSICINLLREVVEHYVLTLGELVNLAGKTEVNSDTLKGNVSLATVKLSRSVCLTCIAVNRVLTVTYVNAVNININDVVSKVTYEGYVIPLIGSSEIIGKVNIVTEGESGAAGLISENNGNVKVGEILAVGCHVKLYNVVCGGLTGSCEKMSVGSVN